MATRTAALSAGAAIVFAGTPGSAQAHHDPAHTDFNGTNIAIRSTPGGDKVGEGNRGDGAWWHSASAGPRVNCDSGGSTVAWHLVTNEHTDVAGYVSGCYLGDGVQP